MGALHNPIAIALMAAIGLGQSQDADSSFRPAFEVASKAGPKFKESKFDESALEKGLLPGLQMRPYELARTSVDIHLLAEELSRRLSRNVIDRTGLDGEYNFDLRWAPMPQTGTHLPTDRRSLPLCRNKWD